MHLHDAGGGELLQAGLQFGGEFHAPNYSRYIYLINYIYFRRP